MSDDRPVFVIHGIANRDPQVVAGRVAELSAAALGRWTMHSAYWGDLGSSTLGVELAMPPGPGSPGTSATAGRRRSPTTPAWGSPARSR